MVEPFRESAHRSGEAQMRKKKRHPMDTAEVEISVCREQLTKIPRPSYAFLNKKGNLSLFGL
jgi:hypothetical protein